MSGNQCSNLEQYSIDDAIELKTLQNEEAHESDGEAQRTVADKGIQGNSFEKAVSNNMGEGNDGVIQECQSDAHANTHSVSEDPKLSHDKPLVSVLRKGPDVEQVVVHDETGVPTSGSLLSTKRSRKISRVEFRITPAEVSRIKNEKHSSLEGLNRTLNLKHHQHGSPQQLKKARKSFSGSSLMTATHAARVMRFSVGANRQPKGLTRDHAAQPLPENITLQSVQSVSESKVFVQMDELDLKERTWRETTRWMKYEERVQANGSWSRPQIPFVEFEGFLALKDYLAEGLVFLEFTSDGLLDFSHTLATTISMCNRIESRYRLKLQQIIYLSVLHQGDTRKRLLIKKRYRDLTGKSEAERRTERMNKAFEMTDDRVRNLWINLCQKAVMFSKFSAGWDDEDLDCDEAIINISCGGKQSKETRNNVMNQRRFLNAQEDGCSVTISEIYEVNPDRYPLTGNQEHLLKALSNDCAGVAIKYAPLDFLKEFESFAVLVRMTHEVRLYDFLEVPIDCKFVFLLCVSPTTDLLQDVQVCRAFGSLMTDKVFRHDILFARKKQDILTAIDKYVKDSVLFPPGQWDIDYFKSATEEISQLSAQRHVSRSETIRTPPRKRKKSYFVAEETLPPVAENSQSRKVSPIQRALPIRRDTLPSFDDVFPLLTEFHEARRPSIVYDPLLAQHPLKKDGRWFGGMRREMSRRYPLYWSDIKDAFHVQCLAAFFFVTFGVIALAVTFGKLLVKYTNGYMGDKEMLLATSFSCMLMAVIGTEPHTVIGGTAAMVIIETVVYKAANLVDVHYLTWRLWIGVWIAIILLLILAFERTYWITYCTRFTEEILHSLVAILFILEAFKDIYKVFHQHPVRDSIVISNDYEKKINRTNLTSSSKMESNGRPNTALLHTIILFCTFGIAIGLRLFQDTRYFTPPIRRLLNFFSIPLAVSVMYVVANLLDVYLKTVEIKPGIKLTSPNKRSWFINPSLSGKGRLDWGMAFLAVFPAFFVVIVVFIETEITALMCYKDTISRKGSGFHTNLLVVAISVFICSFLGLPWMCLAAVETSNHIDSLRVWTSYNIPGIKSHVEKIRQQRITLFFIGLATGLFLYLPFNHGHIPIALLSGLTLYMGVVATFGVQFFKRVNLIFMAPSQHPYIEYLTNVSLFKVHLFTIIQIVMITLLMVIKMVESISFIFPFFILLMIPTRVLLGKYVFTPEEMDQLDNEEEDEDH